MYFNVMFVVFNYHHLTKWLFVCQDKHNLETSNKSVCEFSVNLVIINNKMKTTRQSNLD